MFDIGSSELLLIIVVAVVVIGPKDLPRALYKLGQIIGKGRAMTRHFRSGLDAMIREAELEELEKKWAAENARIMAEHPQEPSDETVAALPAPEGQDDPASGMIAEGVIEGGDLEPEASSAVIDAGSGDEPDNTLGQTSGQTPGHTSREASA